MLVGSYRPQADGRTIGLADYGTSVTFTRGQTNSIMSRMLVAHMLWRRERNTHNARAFMLACAKLRRAR